MSQIIMLVTHNHDYTQSIEKQIKKQFPLGIISYSTVQDALNHLATPSSLQPDVVFFELTDNPRHLDAIVQMRALRRDLQIIALVSHIQTELAVKALGIGASDFLMMPFHYSQLLSVVPNAIHRRDLQILARNATSGTRLNLKDIEPESAAFSATLFIANQLAANESHMVVQGSNGTGRELLVRAIHGASKQAEHPFLTVNAALYKEDELIKHCFDWEDGIFAKVGRGTIFLRNVEKLGRDFYVALEAVVTRGFISDKGVQPFAGRLVFAVDDALVDADKERNDIQNYLFAKINAISMRMPTLREIKEDIPRLAMLLCRRYAAIEGKVILTMAEDVKKMLKESTWPGNLEQLGQCVFDAVMQARGNQLELGDFRYLFNTRTVTANVVSPFKVVDENAVKPVVSCVDKSGKVRRLKDVEQELIQYALERYSGHMSDVAKHLGIGRSTLYRKISNRSGDKGN